MPIMNKLAALARSPQGRRMAQQAMRYARSPQGRARIASVRERFVGRRTRRR